MRPQFVVLAAVAVVLVAGAFITLVIPSQTAAAHDARVKSDLAAVAAALEVYYDKNHTYRIPGTGYAGEGEGWVDINLGTGSDAYYTHSILGQLQKLGYLGSSVRDDATYTYPKHPTARNYMLYVCDSGQTYALSATLERPAAPSTAKRLNCKAQLSSKFGKNYLVAKTNKSTASTSVAAIQFPSCTITASKVAKGPGVLLAWRAKGADAVVLQSSLEGTLSAVPSAGSIMVAPTRTVVYSIVATNAAGATKCQRSVAAVASTSVSVEAPASQSLASTADVPPPGQLAAVFSSQDSSSAVAVRQALGDLAKISDKVAQFSPSVARVAAGSAAADMHAASVAAEASRWDETTVYMQSYNSNMRQVSALLGQWPRQTSTPDPTSCSLVAFLHVLEADVHTIGANYAKATGVPNNSASAKNRVVSKTHQDCANLLFRTYIAIAPACASSQTPSRVAVGQTFTDSWRSVGATSLTYTVSLGGVPVIGPGPSGVSGSYQSQWSTPGTYTYKREFSGPGGTKTCTTYLRVTGGSSSF